MLMIVYVNRFVALVFDAAWLTNFRFFPIRLLLVLHVLIDKNGSGSTLHASRRWASQPRLRNVGHHHNMSLLCIKAKQYVACHV